MVGQTLHSTLIQIGAFGSLKCCVKLWYVFSDPMCPFVFKKCDAWIDIKTKLSGRQGTDFLIYRGFFYCDVVCSTLSETCFAC